jgi:hypothetical protein
MSINISDYSPLSSYAVLAGSGITTCNRTSIPHGFYGTPGGRDIRGPFVGYENSGEHASITLSKLSDLVNDINSKALCLESRILGIVSKPITLFPNINYNGGEGGSITFENIVITLNGKNIENPQFFIRADNIYFNQSSSIILTGGALASNIFWLANKNLRFKAINYIPNPISGIFIAGKSIDITLPVNVVGGLYSQSETVNFTQNENNDETIVTAPYVPSSVSDNSIVSNDDSIVSNDDSIVFHVTESQILTNDCNTSIQNMISDNNVVSQEKKLKKTKICLTSEQAFLISKFKETHPNFGSRPIYIKKALYRKVLQYLNANGYRGKQLLALFSLKPPILLNKPHPKKMYICFS